MACRPAWIIHEQRGRVAVCCWGVKGGIGGLGVCIWRWGVPMAPSKASARGMALNSLPLGMCRAIWQRGGGWMLL